MDGFWAHAYQFDTNTATFIVECSQRTFDKFGFSNLSAGKHQYLSVIYFLSILTEII